MIDKSRKPEPGGQSARTPSTSGATRTATPALTTSTTASLNPPTPGPSSSRMDKDTLKSSRGGAGQTSLNVKASIPVQKVVAGSVSSPSVFAPIPLKSLLKSLKIPKKSASVTAHPLPSDPNPVLASTSSTSKPPAQLKRAPATSTKKSPVLSKDSQSTKKVVPGEKKRARFNDGDDEEEIERKSRYLTKQAEKQASYGDAPHGATWTFRPTEQFKVTKDKENHEYFDFKAPRQGVKGHEHVEFWKVAGLKSQAEIESLVIIYADMALSSYFGNLELNDVCRDELRQCARFIKTVSPIPLYYASLLRVKLPVPDQKPTPEGCFFSKAKRGENRAFFRGLWIPVDVMIKSLEQGKELLSYKVLPPPECRAELLRFLKDDTPLDKMRSSSFRHLQRESGMNERLHRLDDIFLSEKIKAKISMNFKAGCKPQKGSSIIRDFSTFDVEIPPYRSPPASASVPQSLQLLFTKDTKTGTLLLQASHLLLFLVQQEGRKTVEWWNHTHERTVKEGIWMGTLSLGAGSRRFALSSGLALPREEPSMLPVHGFWFDWDFFKSEFSDFPSFCLRLKEVFDLADRSFSSQLSPRSSTRAAALDPPSRPSISAPPTSLGSAPIPQPRSVLKPSALAHQRRLMRFVADLVRPAIATSFVLQMLIPCEIFDKEMTRYIETGQTDHVAFQSAVALNESILSSVDSVDTESDQSFIQKVVKIPGNRWAGGTETHDLQPYYKCPSCSYTAITINQCHNHIGRPDASCPIATNGLASPWIDVVARFPILWIVDPLDPMVAEVYGRGRYLFRSTSGDSFFNASKSKRDFQSLRLASHRYLVADLEKKFPWADALEEFARASFNLEKPLPLLDSVALAVCTELLVLPILFTRVGGYDPNEKASKYGGEPTAWSTVLSILATSFTFETLQPSFLDGSTSSALDFNELSRDMTWLTFDTCLSMSRRTVGIDRSFLFPDQIKVSLRTPLDFPPTPSPFEDKSQVFLSLIRTSWSKVNVDKEGGITPKAPLTDQYLHDLIERARKRGRLAAAMALVPDSPVYVGFLSGCGATSYPLWWQRPVPLFYDDPISHQRFTFFDPRSTPSVYRNPAPHPSRQYQLNIVTTSWEGENVVPSHSIDAYGRFEEGVNFIFLRSAFASGMGVPVADAVVPGLRVFVSDIPARTWYFEARRTIENWLGADNPAATQHWETQLDQLLLRVPQGIDVPEIHRIERLLEEWRLASYGREDHARNYIR